MRDGRIMDLLLAAGSVESKANSQSKTPYAIAKDTAFLPVNLEFDLDSQEWICSDVDENRRRAERRLPGSAYPRAPAHISGCVCSRAYVHVYVRPSLVSTELM